MSLDLQFLRIDSKLILQPRGNQFDVRLVGAKRARAAPVGEVQAVLDLGKRMLRQMHCLEVLALIDVVQSDVKGNQRVEVELLKLIYRLLDGVDDAGDAFLLAIEGTQCALRLQGLLDKADDVLRLLLTGQLFLLVAEAAAEKHIHVELAGESLRLQHVSLLRAIQFHELHVG